MLYFDGYCPECALQGQQQRMQLNTHNYWECPQSALQIMETAPFATILRWRGNGQFRQDQILPPTGLLLAEANKAAGQALQPDSDFLLTDEAVLGWYLHEVCDSFRQFQQHQFNAKDPLFHMQSNHLVSIQLSQWQLIFESFRLFSQTGIRFNIRKAAGFRIVEQYMRQFGVIFTFDWQHWHRGWVNIRDVRFRYSQASLLELSMYLSAIFLSEPFDEGTVEFYFNNKTLEKMLDAMEANVMIGR